jgi:8-oxo-dGTP diphosphatase
MSYTYKYARPALTVDCVVFGFDGNEALNVLLIQRAHEPFEGRWALPGGFAEVGESLENAAARELEEETGLSGVPLEQLHTFGNPDRDPREHVVTVAYLARVNPAAHEVRAASDATKAAWFPLDELPKLAFDHDEIITVAEERLGAP